MRLEEVRANFNRYGLLDAQVEFLEGWFPGHSAGRTNRATSRDAAGRDHYESTWNALTNLYPKLSPGGYVIIDDYLLIDPCRAAVDDFRDNNAIIDELEAVDWNAVFWRKR